jgi:hypothetical protein
MVQEPVTPLWMILAVLALLLGAGFFVCYWLWGGPDRRDEKG